MSICGGYAGARGKNPVGIFIHNDAGGQRCTTAHYRDWLPGHNLDDGFAHYYVCSDGILQAEDDSNRAYHCGQTDGNYNYLSIEVCQSMGDLATFKANEEKALQLAAQKCKQYGITPNNTTIKLHKEVSATACPHRSVEIHGGDAATKAYFIKRIKELMGNTGVATTADSTVPVNQNQCKKTKKGETTMQCFYKITDKDKNKVYYFDGFKVHPLNHIDEMNVLNNIYKANNGCDMPIFNWTSKAPWYTRLKQAMARVE